MLVNICSAGQYENTFQPNKVPNERISSNGSHSYFHEFTKEQDLHLFIFSTLNPQNSIYSRLYKIYDRIISQYLEKIYPALVLGTIQNHLQERQVILDIDEELHRKLNILKTPELLLVDGSNHIVSRVPFFNWTEMQQTLRFMTKQYAVV